MPYVMTRKKLHLVCPYVKTNGQTKTNGRQGATIETAAGHRRAGTCRAAGGHGSPRYVAAAL